MGKKFLFIDNPKSSKKYSFKKLLKGIVNNPNEVEFITVKKVGDSAKYIKKAIQNNIDTVGVMGGDGTVAEAAKTLFRTRVKLLIIPGGTANIIAKELGIGKDPEFIIKAFIENRLKNKYIDMGLANEIPFLVRINWGISAQMVTKTPAKMKKKIGQTAYTITALKELLKQDEVDYYLTVDGKKKEIKSVSLMVANSGNVGFENLSIVPQVSVTDGKLDVIVIKKANLAFLASLSKIAFKKRPSSLLHWRAKRILIKTGQSHSILFDDMPVKGSSVDIRIVPKALNILVPQ